MGSLLYGALKNTFMQVMTHGLPGLRVMGALGGREDVLPGRFAVGIGVFTFESIGKASFTIAFFEVCLMDLFDVLDVFPERRGNTFGEGNGTVAFTLAIADDNLAVGEVYIFDTEAKGLHQPEPGTK